MENTVKCTVYYIHILCNTIYLKAKDSHKNTILFLRCTFIHHFICSVTGSSHPGDKTEGKKKTCTQKKIFSTYKLLMMMKAKNCNVTNVCAVQHKCHCQYQ